MKVELPDIEGFELADGEQPRIPKNLEYFYVIGSDSEYQCKRDDYPDVQLIIKKKVPVYEVIGMGDLGCIVFGVDVRGSDKKYVEIKALEDAMRIIKMMNRDTDPRAEGFDNYAPLKELL